MSYSKKRGEEYKTVAAVASLKPWATKDRSGRVDNKQLAEKVRGHVYTGAAKKAVPRMEGAPWSDQDKGRGVRLDAERFYAAKRRAKSAELRDVSRLEVPAGASADERAKMKRWLEEADAISRRQRS